MDDSTIGFTVGHIHFSCNGTENCVCICIARALCDSADILATSCLLKDEMKQVCCLKIATWYQNHTCKQMTPSNNQEYQV